MLSIKVLQETIEKICKCGAPPGAGPAGGDDWGLQVPPPRKKERRLGHSTGRFPQHASY
jgi:hypothetical protein